MVEPKEQCKMSQKDEQVKVAVPQQFVRDPDLQESDERLSRASADAERNQEDGTMLSMEERKALLRREWKNDVLPAVPNDSKYHYCWLSTNNQTDPIYRRLRIGYELVKKEWKPDLNLQSIAVSAEYEGFISINEMILARIPLELFEELMLINHYEKPLEEEELLKANLVNPEDEDTYDSKGRPLGSTEGKGIKNLARRTNRPTFI